MTPNQRIFLNIIATYGRSLYALVCWLFISQWVLAAVSKTDFGLYGVVGGMMGIELLAYTMRPTATGLPQRNFHHGVLSNRNMVDYAAVQSDECPDRTARPERPFPDGPAAVRL